MPQRRITLELDLGRQPAEAPGAAVTTATATHVISGALVANPDGAGGVIGLFPGWQGYEPIEVRLRLTPPDAEDDQFLVWGYEGTDTWWVEGANPATNSGNQTNAGRDCLFATHNVAPIPTTIVEPGFAVDGNTRALFPAATAFEGTVALRRIFAANTTGQLLVGEFAEENELGPDGFSLDERTRVELQEARFAGVRVELNSGLVINNCARAYVDPWSRVWLGPGDLGLGNDELPPSLDLITANSLRRFPSIFVRRADYIRGVRAPTAASSNAVNTGPAAPNVYQVIRPPTHSRWRIWLDSRMCDVVLAHPVGSDLRTPAAAYNAVFAAGILNVQQYANPVPIYRRINDPVTPSFAIQGHITRTPFLEAAEFVEFMDDQVAAIQQLVLLPA
jgi:hypothetical protein